MNHDGLVNVLDVVELVNLIILGTAAPATTCSDLNSDLSVDILDAVILVNDIVSTG